MNTAEPEIDQDLAARLSEYGEPQAWTPRAGRRNGREKLEAGLRGFKYAFRGDSSFFAHAYRGFLFALAALLLGIGPHQWCLVLLAGGLVLVAELCHSAVDTLARALGDPESPGLVVAREIASAAVLVAVLIFCAIAVILLVTRLAILYTW